MKTLTILFAIILAAPGIPRAAEPPALWLYQATNLWVDANVDRLEEIWRRAARAGYTAVILADSKFARLADMDNRYFRNVDRVKKLAAELKLDVVPALFSIGYSNNMLWHGPELAEGLPVRDALLVVKGGEARVVADPPVALAGAPDWKDDCFTLEDGAAIARGHHGNARLVWKVRAARHRAYHVSARIRTEGYTGEPRIQALAGGKALQFASLGVKGTQDWKEHHAVFNSLENEEVSIYLGTWGSATGTLSWKDWQIEEAGPVNILRRPGAPFEVKGYIEGKDFERLEDPLCGTVPYRGEYTVWHEAPPLKTRLPDGTRLRASWHHAVVIHEGQVSACLSEPRVAEILRDEARRVREAWGARGYMMSHDEIRTLNQDEACRRRNLDAGAILAANARECEKLLEGSTAHVWSDMFDPHHNAVKDYYLVRGDFSGSWEGLSPKVVIVNWNFEKRRESLRFFEKRGHRQVIAGYYDGPASQVKDWLEAARGLEGVVAILYTTWQNKYDDLESFARAARS